MLSLVPGVGTVLSKCFLSLEVSVVLHRSRASTPTHLLPLPWGTSYIQKKKSTGIHRPALLRWALATGGRWGVGGVPSPPAVIYSVLPFGKHCSTRLSKVTASVLRLLYEKGEEKVGNVSNFLRSWLRASH